MKLIVNGSIALNACIWPWVFGGYAILNRDAEWVFTFCAAGLLFGGTIFVLIAGALALIRQLLPQSPLVQQVGGSAPGPWRLATGGFVMIAIGAVGIINELLSGRAIH
jgi:hypothetical protein